MIDVACSVALHEQLLPACMIAVGHSCCLHSDHVMAATAVVIAASAVHIDKICK